MGAVSRFRNLFEFTDKLRYIWWQLSGSKNAINLRLKSGTRMQLRPKPSSDYDVAYEIWIFQQYALNVESETVKYVVDLGGNVGYSCLYWAEQFPHANILAFEPHPANAECFGVNIRLNRLENRVQLKEAAAGTAEGTTSFLNAGTTSRVCDEASPGTIQVRIEDFFRVVGSKTIDILKIDIEGGEYALFADPRFKDLRFQNLVMEWHANDSYPNGGKWCAQKLRDIGYKVDGEENGSVGLLRATMLPDRP